MLAHFMDVFEPLKLFIVGKGETERFPYLDAKEWMLAVAFLCDITQHLNKLNVKMQGNNKTVYELYTAVKKCSAKLQLLHSSVSKGDYRLFSSVQKVMRENPNAAPSSQQHFCDVLAELNENYTARFSDFKNHD